MNILYINACVRKNSRTNILAQYLLKNFNQKVDELNLNNENILPLSQNILEKRDFLIKTQNFNDNMFKYAKQFANADTIIISAPLWDLSFPANLKAYFETINVTGITFQYDKEGRPHTLCKAKKLIYLTTSGGEICIEDYGFNYVKALCNTFYGINDITCIKATGLDIIGANIESILNKTKQEIDKMTLLN